MTREERRLYYRNLEQTMTEQERADLQRERAERHRARIERWNHEHYKTVSCRVPVDTARKFEMLCYRHGKTPYRALKDAIEAALDAAVV